MSSDEQLRNEQEMDEYTQHEVISEMSEEELVENDIAGWGDAPEPTDTHIVWIYNDNCVMPGKPWNQPNDGNDGPIFEVETWGFDPEKIESGDIEDTFKDIFGDDFPAGDVHYLTGTRDELEANIYGEGEQA